MTNKSINLSHQREQETFRDLIYFSSWKMISVKYSYFLLSTVWCELSDLTKSFPIVVILGSSYGKIGHNNTKPSKVQKL